MREEPPDWPGLAREASALGLGPLLYDTLRRLALPQVPDEMMVELRKQYYDAAGYNMLILKELVTILRNLSEMGVQAAVLKGAALILYVYERMAQRPMVDLDLLLPFEDLEKAKEVFKQLGYTELSPRPFEDYSGLCWNELMVVREDGKGPTVELHWHLLDNPYYAGRLTTPTLISRSKPKEIADVQAQVLDLEDQIIHLSCHNYYHHLGGFTRSLVDIAFVIARYGDEVRWQELLSRAVDSDTKMAVRSAFDQLTDGWYTKIPETAQAEMESWSSSLREQYYAWSQRREYLRSLRTLGALPSLGLKMRFLRGQLFPQSSYLEWRYGIEPGTPWPLAYSKRLMSGVVGTGRLLTGREKVQEKSPPPSKGAGP